MEDENKEAANDDNKAVEVLDFLDSVDSYLTLFDSLSSTLRQGWLELASARHSMGSARISSTLFDLNCHTAPTSLKLTYLEEEEEEDHAVDKTKQPSFTLCKWGSCDLESSSEEAKLQEDELLTKLRCKGTSEIQEKQQESNGCTLKVEDQIQKERSKSLSVFGTLVSPKLRAAQLSFETALEILVEIANTHSAMLSAHNKVQKRGCRPTEKDDKIA